MIYNKVMIFFTALLLLTSCEKFPFGKDNQNSVKSERFGMSRRIRLHGSRAENMDLERLCRGLDLTEEQGLEIKKINEIFSARHLAIREVLEPLEDNLRVELRRDKVDLNKVKDILKEMSEPEISRRLLMIEHRIEVEKVLSPEQLSRARRHNRQFRKR